MFSNVKKLYKMSKKTKCYDETKYDEEDRAILNISVKDDSNFLSPLSYGTEEIISSEVADFIEKSSKSVPVKKDLHFIIHSKEIDDQERVVYERAIKRYFGIMFTEKKKQLKNNAIIALIMSLIAIGIFAFIVILKTTGIGSVLEEIIDITGWVFMWEAVDLFFLQRQVLRLEQLRNVNIIHAKISFIE